MTRGIRNAAILGFIVSLLVCAVATADNPGGVYKLTTENSRVVDTGSAVAIYSVDSRAHFLTASHVLDLPAARSVVWIGGRSHAVEIVQSMPAYPEPILLIRTIRPLGQTQYKTYRLAAEEIRQGDAVWLIGWPHGRYQATKATCRNVQRSFTGHITVDRASSGGASGGAVLNADGEIAGIITHTSPGTTVAVNVLGALTSTTHKEVNWRCYKGSCRWVAPQSYCFGYVQPQQQPRPPVVWPRPSVQPTVRPPIDRDEILTDLKIHVTDWLEQNKSQLRGSPGESGAVDINQIAAAIVSQYGEQIRGPEGKPGGAENLANIEARLSAMESRALEFVIASDGKIIDRETYQPGEPIVLDVKTLLRAAE